MLLEKNEQISFYDYLDKKDDPLFRELLTLEETRTLKVLHYVLIKNVFGLYELSSEEEHVVFSSLDELYFHLVKTINYIQFSS